MSSRKELILGTIDDLVSNFLYYDRRSDEELPEGAIEETIEEGEITVGEIVKRFREQLKENL